MPIGQLHEHITAAGNNSAKSDGQPLDYWHGLINEKVAAEFLALAVRTMQDLRQRGGGPRFVRISSRCVRYRRADLKDWADARMRASTADDGRAA